MRTIVVGMLLMVALAGCTSTSSEDVPVGVLMPLTGPAASLGAPAEKGAQLAAQEINAAGGIDGKTLRLVVEDTKFPEQTETVAAYERMKAKGVQVLVGALASDSSVAVRTRADQDQIVMISPSSTRPSLTEGDHGYFFRTIANDNVQGPQAADLLFNELGIDGAVVMFQDTGYAQGLKDVFVPAYRDQGGSVVGDPIQWTDDAATMGSKAQEAMQRGAPGIWIAGQAPEIGTLIKALRDGGFTGKILASEAIEAAEVFDTGGAAMEGVYFTKSSPDVAGAAYQKFESAYKVKFGSAPGPFDAFAYDAVYVAAAAIEAVGNDGAKIKAWLESNSVSGRVTTNSIAFLNGDVTTGGYKLWVIKDNGFQPA